MEKIELSRRNFLAGLAAGAGTALLNGFGCTAPGPSGTPLNDAVQLKLHEVSRAMRDRSLSPVELTRACLDRINRLDSRFNSFITVTAEQALSDARVAENELTKGNWRGPLHGVPIALKDLIDTAGILTSAGSGVFAKRIPAEDAEVVRLLKAAGAVIIGKLNLHEFGMGATSAISHFGPVRNPWNVQVIAGGSSGGSAAAVAARFCFGALGTDSGGSIRIPSACCGVVGFKPTYGLVSNQGVIPLSMTYDHVGPICRSATDVALMLRAITNHPILKEFDPEGLSSDVSRLRIGVLRTSSKAFCDVPANQEVQTAFDSAVEALRSMVAEIRDAELVTPDLGSLIEAEWYEYHSRYVTQTPELYDLRTKNSVLNGNKIKSKEVTRLRKAVQDYRASVHQAFSDVDVMVIPTLPELPMALAEADDPFEQSACTFPFNIGGLPTISVPCGFSQFGLPIGMQLTGPPNSDARILALAQAYERVTDWHKRRPPQ